MLQIAREAERAELHRPLDDGIAHGRLGAPGRARVRRREQNERRNLQPDEQHGNAAFRGCAHLDLSFVPFLHYSKAATLRTSNKGVTVLRC